MNALTNKKNGLRVWANYTYLGTNRLSLSSLPFGACAKGKSKISTIAECQGLTSESHLAAAAPRCKNAVKFDLFETNKKRNKANVPWKLRCWAERAYMPWSWYPQQCHMQFSGIECDWDSRLPRQAWEILKKCWRYQRKQAFGRFAGEVIGKKIEILWAWGCSSASLTKRL